MFRNSSSIPAMPVLVGARGPCQLGLDPGLKKGGVSNFLVHKGGGGLGVGGRNPHNPPPGSSQHSQKILSDIN